MKHRIFLYGLLCALAVCAPQARAQVFDAATNVNNDSIGFGEQNPQLKSLLTLQYQIQLLKQMIEHEKTVNKIVTSALNIGIKDPAIPSPDRELCLQIPANIPCAQAYTGLYEGFSVAMVVPAAPAAPEINAMDIPALDAKDLPALNDTALVEAEHFYWTDITCLAKKCSAVISPNPQDPGARYRINPGEKLPDGSVIQAISADGVRIERDKKIILLDPAPQA